MNDDVIVGLDIGTKNIRVVVAERLEDGGLQVVGIGKSSSNGMRKGSVTNIESTVSGIHGAIEAAEMMSGLDINHCTIGLGGSHIEGFNSRGVFPISDKGRTNKEISQSDIDSVIESAKAVVIPIDREIIHVIPQTYTVDRQHCIKDPLNMIGVRLEADVHIITGAVTSIKNIILCVNRADLQVENLIYHGLADVKAVMTKDEQETGSVLIDIGAGTTDIVLMQDGAPIMTSSIPVGGIQVTNDLAVVKGVPFDAAEKIKIFEGCCWPGFIEENESTILPAMGGMGPKEILKSEICEVLQLRMAELFAIIKNKVYSVTDGRPLKGSVVLCGGGALLNGTAELAAEIFDMPSVRLGVPSTIGGLTGEYRSPEFAAVMGLILNVYDSRKQVQSAVPVKGGESGSMLKKVRSFLKELF